jgi:hypothetical protein
MYHVFADGALLSSALSTQELEMMNGEILTVNKTRHGSHRDTYCWTNCHGNRC